MSDYNLSVTIFRQPAAAVGSTDIGALARPLQIKKGGDGPERITVRRQARRPPEAVDRHAALPLTDR